MYRKGVPSCAAMRSSLWRCSSLMPGATGTGTMPPSMPGPERVDERLVVRQEQQQPIPRPGAELLQVMQDAQRALVQFGIAHHAPLALALVIGD